MMRALLAAITVMLLLVVACSSPSTPSAPSCQSINVGCMCNHQPPPPAGGIASCNASVLPQTLCCADSGWPSSGSCLCLTSAIFCGVVPGYETAADGGPGEDACVCSSDPYGQQVVGPTCYSNGTTTSGAGLGTCCMFSADAPGAAGVPACLCAAGIHTCGTGGVAVGMCSAASFPSTAPSCDQGTKQVEKCL
jgi:hypothetical protein